VKRFRESLGVAPKCTPRRPTLIDWHKQPLGEMPDLQLAVLLRCSNSTVYSARKALGIKAHGHHKKEQTSE
jgi:hypothetical protein